MNASETITYIIVLIFSVVLHEVAHGYAADALGDRTARYSGRLTINPLPHLDPLGSVILPFILVLSGSPFLVGWAKPVPFNLNNIRDKKWGPTLIALAGPAVNLLLALIFAGFIHLQGLLGLSSDIVNVFTAVVIINLVLMLFNLIPVPPLDGHHVLFGLLHHPRYDSFKNFMRRNQLILIIVAMFLIWPNLVPLVFYLVDWLL